MLRVVLSTAFILCATGPLTAQIEDSADGHLEVFDGFPVADFGDGVFPIQDFGDDAGFPTAAGPTQENPLVQVEDSRAAAGSRFEMRIVADDQEEVDEMRYVLSWDPLLITLEDWRAGEAIDEYAEDADAPDCDIWVYPVLGSAEVETIFYDLEFDPAVYGTEVLVLEFSIDEDATEEESFMLLFDIVGLAFDDAIIELVEPDPMLRGDVNGNGERTLVDALALLNYLYDDGEVDCERAGDIDDSGELGASDAITLLLGIFAEAELPDADCQTDLTEDELTCEESGCE